MRSRFSKNCVKKKKKQEKRATFVFEVYWEDGGESRLNCSIFTGTITSKGMALPCGTLGTRLRCITTSQSVSLISRPFSCSSKTTSWLETTSNEIIFAPALLTPLLTIAMKTFISADEFLTVSGLRATLRSRRSWSVASIAWQSSPLKTPSERLTMKAAWFWCWGRTPRKPLRSTRNGTKMKAAEKRAAVVEEEEEEMMRGSQNSGQRMPVKGSQRKRIGRHLGFNFLGVLAWISVWDEIWDGACEVVLSCCCCSPVMMLLLPLPVFPPSWAVFSGALMADDDREWC